MARSGTYDPDEDAAPIGSVDTLLKALADAPDIGAPDVLHPGDVIDETFRVDRKLGSGGMGVVYLARHLQLDREVAVKLHSRLDHATSAERLQREAMAMARLAHPNVIAIHEVGTTGDYVFIAMEFVDGWTGRSWLADRPRSWRDIVAVYADAGRGLAAAHDAGLVHRDFKPENILIGKDGRVRVADFGLARSIEASHADERDVDRAADDPDDPDDPDDMTGAASLTRTGVFVGTPAYMAPEQWQGGDVDARADQFGFCVALYEALYGARPFAGHAPADIAAAVCAGRISDPDDRLADRQVPRHIRHAVLRGLDADPAARHSTMHDLVAALVHDPAARRRRWALLAMSIAAVAFGAFGVWLATRDRTPMCASADSERQAVWPAALQADVERAFLAVNAPYAADTWHRRVKPVLDRYADSWAEERYQACRDTRVRGVQSADLLDRRIACLDRRRGEFDAVIGVFARADDTVVRNAVKAAQGIAEPSGCGDRARLLAPVAPPGDPQTAARVADLRARVADLRALYLTGKARQALDTADDTLALAREIGYRPALAEVFDLLGRLQLATSSLADAEASLERAFFIARGAGHDDIAPGIAIALIGVIGTVSQRFDDAEQWSKHALAEVERSGAGSVDHAQLLRVLGTVHDLRGDHAEAMDHLRRSLAMFESLHGDEQHRDISKVLNSIAVVLGTQGKYADAVAYRKRALAIDEQVLGPAHPDVGSQLDGLGLDLADLGRHDEAIATLDRGLAITQAALGADHIQTGYGLLNLGVAMHRKGDDHRAIELYERALAIVENKLGKRHPDVGLCLNSLAMSLQRTGQLDAALDRNRQGLDISREVFGDKHWQVAHLVGNQGTILTGLGRHTQAVARFREAIAMWEQIGPEHPVFAIQLTDFGEALLTRGQPGQAVAPLERAHALYETITANPEQAARTRTLLDRARQALRGGR